MPAARPSLVLRAASVSDVQGGKHGIGPSSREKQPKKTIELNHVARYHQFCVLVPSLLGFGDEASRNPNLLPCSGRIGPYPLG